MHFEINGKSLNVTDTDQCCANGEPAALVDMVMGLGKKLEGLACPVHGERPVIRLLGSSLDNLEREVQACCSEFLAEVWKKL